MVAWNGVGLLPQHHQQVTKFTSDASGSWGCEAWCGTSWFQFQWPQQASEHHISFLELAAVVIACVVQGPQWKGQLVHCRCDNETAVHVIRSWTCRDPGLMHLLRSLFFIEAAFQFQLTASHISGGIIGLADDLSRDRLSSFLALVPQAHTKPTMIPEDLPLILFHQELDWTSPTWTNWFVTIVIRDWPSQPTGPTEQD